MWWTPFGLEVVADACLSVVPHGVSRNYPERRFLLIGRSATSGSVDPEGCLTASVRRPPRIGYQRQIRSCEESANSHAVGRARVTGVATPSLYLRAKTERGTFGTSIDPVHRLRVTGPPRRRHTLVSAVITPLVLCTTKLHMCEARRIEECDHYAVSKDVPVLRSTSPSRRGSSNRLAGTG